MVEGTLSSCFPLLSGTTLPPQCTRSLCWISSDFSHCSSVFLRFLSFSIGWSNVFSSCSGIQRTILHGAFNHIFALRDHRCPTICTTSTGPLTVRTDTTSRTVLGTDNPVKSCNDLFVFRARRACELPCNSFAVLVELVNCFFLEFKS